MFVLSIPLFSFHYPCPSALLDVLHFKGNPLRSAVVTANNWCTPNEEHTLSKFVLSAHSMGLHVRFLQTQTNSHWIHHTAHSEISFTCTSLNVTPKTLCTEVAMKILGLQERCYWSYSSSGTSYSPKELDSEKKDITWFFEISVTNYKPTRTNIPEDFSLQKLYLSNSTELCVL